VSNAHHLGGGRDHLRQPLSAVNGKRVWVEAGFLLYQCCQQIGIKLVLNADFLNKITKRNSPGEFHNSVRPFYDKLFAWAERTLLHLNAGLMAYRCAAPLLSTSA